MTINVKPETQNRRLEPTGLAKPGTTRCLTGMGPGLARQESAGRVAWQLLTRTGAFGSVPTQTGTVANTITEHNLSFEILALKLQLF